MTLEEFNNLEIGSEVYLPDTYREGKFMSTEVLEINKDDQTLKVLLGGDKFLSYQNVEKFVLFEKISYVVGLSKGPRMGFWKMFAALNAVSE